MVFPVLFLQSTHGHYLKLPSLFSVFKSRFAGVVVINVGSIVVSLLLFSFMPIEIFEEVISGVNNFSKFDLRNAK